MSRPGNMLRTRRRDNNVKPNRRNFRVGRLDRKSSRGMIYENEELRLRTININAEIERGQYDIKKLKRENELLKKEIWCLRDEYEKLDKLLKEKDLEFSSSSTTGSTSDSESCSSCTEECDETNQNTENCNKTTNMRNLDGAFDHLSIVPEESTDNSDRTSAHDQENQDGGVNASCDVTNNMAAASASADSDVLHADQSYPLNQSCSSTKTNFFSPIRTKPVSPTLKTSDVIYPNELYETTNSLHRNNVFESNKIVNTNSVGNVFQNMTLVPKNVHSKSCEDILQKREADLVVKMCNGLNGDFYNETGRPVSEKLFSQNSHSTFSNGGNLEELLNDIETISQDILAISHNPLDFQQQNENFQNTIDAQNFHRPYRSEINVTLLPKPMPLLGFDKYRNIQQSFENIHHQESLSLDNLTEHEHPNGFFLNGPPPVVSTTKNNQCYQLNSPTTVLPPEMQKKLHCPPSGQKSPVLPQNEQNANGYMDPTQTPMLSALNGGVFGSTRGKFQDMGQQPFLFGHLQDNYVNNCQQEYFLQRYNPENYNSSLDTNVPKVLASKSDNKQSDNGDSKTSLIHPTSSEQTSSDNDDLNRKNSSKTKPQISQKAETSEKSPKMNLRHKVSIHFKGSKKEKPKKQLSLDLNPPEQAPPKKSPIGERKSLPNTPDPKTIAKHQKTSSIDSKKSIEQSNDVKEQKHGLSDQKNAPNDPKTTPNEQKNTPNDTKTEKKQDAAQKQRKSASTSPERKHVIVAVPNTPSTGPKKHKKHRKSEKASKTRRSTANNIYDRSHRERSYSNCTDRSMLGYLYDDYYNSERDSMSSCETTARKMSSVSNIPLNAKIPWCACWGNGCL